MSPRTFATSLLGTLLLFGAATAAWGAEPSPSAADKRAAKAKLVEGGKLLEAGDYADALARFQAAYELVPSPKIQFNFGLACMGLGRNADAIGAFDSFLAEATDADGSSVAKAHRYRGDLLKKVGRLTVSSDVDGAAVVIDGRPHGTTPLPRPIFLDPGPHLLLVEKAGAGAPFTHRLEVAAGASAVLAARLGIAPPPVQAPASSALPAPSAAPVTSPPPAPSPATAPAAAPPAPAGPGPRASSWRRTTALVVGGAALVALGVGGFEWLEKEKKFGSFNDDRTCGEAAPGFGGPQCAQWREDGKRAKRLGVASFVAGGVLGASAVGLLVWHSAAPGGETASRTDRTLACAPLLGDAGLACRFVF